MAVLRNDLKLGLAAGAVLLIGGAGYMIFGPSGDASPSAGDALVDPLASQSPSADPPAGASGDSPTADTPADSPPRLAAEAQTPASDWSVLSGEAPLTTETPVPGKQAAPPPPLPTMDGAEPQTPDLNRADVDDAFAAALQEQGERAAAATAAAPPQAANVPPAITGGTPAPVAPTTNPSTAAATTHVVQSGENLSAIAQRHYGDANLFALIERANPGVDSRRLKVGQKLIIPAHDAIDDERAAPAAATEPAADGTSTHTVAAGETLSSIAARRLGRAALWQDLYTLNRALIGDDPAALKVGMTLKLPK